MCVYVNICMYFIPSVIPYLGPLDTFVLSTSNGSSLNHHRHLHNDANATTFVQIEATSGVGAAWGFHYYLTRYGGSHFSWGGAQITSLPRPLPVLKAPVRVTSTTPWRYYQNVCTSSYSFAFWDWKRWEKEIDWMALKGINMPLGEENWVVGFL